MKENLIVEYMAILNDKNYKIKMDKRMIIDTLETMLDGALELIKSYGIIDDEEILEALTSELGLDYYEMED